MTIASNIESAILNFSNYYYIPDIIECLEKVLGKTETLKNEGKRTVNNDDSTRDDDSTGDLEQIIKKINNLCNKQEVFEKIVEDQIQTFFEIKDIKEKRIINYTKQVGKVKRFKTIDLNNRASVKKGQKQIISGWIKELKKIPKIYVEKLCSEMKNIEGRTFINVKDKVDEHLNKTYPSVIYNALRNEINTQYTFTDLPILLESISVKISDFFLNSFGKKIMNKYTKKVRKIAKKKGIYIIYRDGTKFSGVSFNKNGKYSKKKGEPDVKKYSYDQISKMKNRDVKWTELEKLINKMNITTVKRKFGDLHFGFELESKRGCNKFGYKFPQGIPRGHASAALFDKL